MVAWQLSVSLTGTSDGLVRALRRPAREARDLTRDLSGLRRTLAGLGGADLRGLSGQLHSARRDVNALSRDVAELRRQAARGVHLDVRVGSSRLHGDVRSALSSAGSGQGLEVALRLADPGQLRRDVQDAVRWAAWGHRIDIPIGLADPLRLRRDVQAAVRAVSGQTVTVRVRTDTNLGDLTSLGGGAGASGMAGALKGLLLLAPSVIPLTTALAPLPGLLAASAGAAGAFGIAVAGQIGPLTEVASAEQKYQEAVRQHGAHSRQAATAQTEYQSQLAQLPAETQRAAVALSLLKDSYKQWSNSLSGTTMRPLVHSMALMDQLLPRLTPQVRSASRELDRLITLLGGAVTTPGFDAASDRLAAFTDQTLTRMGDRLVHVLRMLSEGRAEGPFADLVNYIRAHGDEARETLSNLGDAVGNLFEGAADAGPMMLTLVNAVARLVAALPPELVGTIIQIAAALKLVQLAGLGAAAVAGGLATLQTRLTALSATAAAAGGGLAGLRAAFLSLGTAARASVVVAGIGVAAVAISKLMNLGRAAPPNIDRLTTALGKLGQSGKVSGELSRAYGKDLDGLYDKIRNITDPSTVDQVQNGLVKVFSLGLADSTPAKEARAHLDALDESLAKLVRGGKADLAAAAYERLKKAYASGGGDVGQLTGQMDEYKSALADARFEQELAAAAQGVFGRAAMDTQAKLEAQKASADGLRQAISALNDVNRAAGSAMSAFEQSLDDTTNAIRNHAGALRMRDGELDLGSKRARDAEKVLSDLAANTDAAAAAAREQGRSWEHVNGILEKGRAAFVDAGDRMGLTRAQAEALADAYLKIPDKKSLTLEMRTEDAVAGLDAVIARIRKTPDAKSVTVKALTRDAVALLESLGFKVTRLKDGSFKVTAETGRARDHLDALQRKRDGLKNKTITLNAKTVTAIAGLDAVIAKIRKTPGAKSVTVRALSQTAIDALHRVGFTTRKLPDGRVVVTARTGSALANIGAVQGARDRLSNKSITITTVRRTIFEESFRKSSKTTADLVRQQVENLRKADGGIVDFYAQGGTRGAATGSAGRRENHIAQIAPAGAWRVWAEDETHGEGYVPFARSKRPRSRRITEEIVRRLGGDPSGILWHADGGLSDWNYQPSDPPSLGSASDIRSRSMRKIKKGKRKGQEYFDFALFEKNLRRSAAAAARWRRDLARVASRAGQDVADALENMGEDGVELTRKMAHGSGKYVRKMASELRKLAGSARASLSDFTKQLAGAVKDQTAFQRNLAKLAASGHGDLAARLAEQGDQSAADLAAQAVKDKKKAKAANSAARKADATLSDEQLATLVKIIGATVSKNTGIHAIADKTGLEEEDIITVASKATGQLKSALGPRAARLLADLAKAKKGLAYADGGIREGIYATRGGLVRFAEPSTGGEAYIPLAPQRRQRATAVLGDVAGRFGYTLTGARDAQAQAVRVIVIRQPAALVGHMPVTVSSPAASPQEFGAEVMRRLRNAQRGGHA
ncbi:hypothetical protein [Streptomyces sp. CC224B]|uniref:hypothetical protein n=1 Tax=Streptomyces sp. CC224B TaxID=3044571 RepID=UPI0024A7CD00|nr:hypothetical protein [Streptomyces sp. CC224B]